MPCFPSTRVILLTLAFYFDFLSTIFPKLCTLEIIGRFLCFLRFLLVAVFLVGSRYLWSFWRIFI